MGCHGYSCTAASVTGHVGTTKHALKLAQRDDVSNSSCMQTEFKCSLGLKINEGSL